jgi:hypothetical protein
MSDRLQEELFWVPWGFLWPLLCLNASASVRRRLSFSFSAFLAGWVLNIIGSQLDIGLGWSPALFLLPVFSMINMLLYLLLFLRTLEVMLLT